MKTMKTKKQIFRKSSIIWGEIPFWYWVHFFGLVFYGWYSTIGQGFILGSFLVQTWTGVHSWLIRGQGFILGLYFVRGPYFVHTWLGIHSCSRAHTRFILGQVFKLDSQWPGVHPPEGPCYGPGMSVVDSSGQCMPVLQVTYHHHHRHKMMISQCRRKGSKVNRTVEEDDGAWTGPPHCGWQVQHQHPYHLHNF